MTTITELFIQFLKDNNVCDKFVINFESYQEVLSLDEYFNYFSINSSTNFIDNAFSFRNTNEGYMFWEHLNLEWKKTLFGLLFPHLITILKKNNLYGYWIVNAYKEGNNLKKQLIPYDYLYKLFKNTEIINTFNYTNARREWIKVISLKTI